MHMPKQGWTAQSFLLLSLTLIPYKQKNNFQWAEFVIYRFICIGIRKKMFFDFLWPTCYLLIIYQTAIYISPSVYWAIFNRSGLYFFISYSIYIYMYLHIYINIWKLSMYNKRSYISHEYLFLNRDAVFKNSEFPHGILFKIFTLQWEKENALLWISWV